MNFSPRLPTPRHLTDLPNLSFVLAEELGKVGIHSPAELITLGAEHAWRALLAAGYHHDVHTLFVLEGAVQGLPWQSLAIDRRHELMNAARFHPGADSGQVAPITQGGSATTD